MSVVTFVAYRTAVLGILACAAYLWARPLTRHLTFHSSSEKLVMHLALGLGLVSYAIYFLGLLGWLTPLALIGVTLPILNLAKSKPSHGRSQKRFRPSYRVLLRAAVATAAVLAVLPLFALSLYPPDPSDATLYHLPAAKIFVDTHRVSLIPHLRFSFMPQLQEMLFAFGIMFADDIVAQMVQALAMFATAALLIAWGRRADSPGAGLASAAVWLGAPFVAHWSVIAYIDAGLGFFCVAGCYAHWVWRETRDARWLLLSAALVGFAAASKYTGLVVVAGLGALTLFHGIRERRPRDVIHFAAVAALTCAPWYAYTAWHTGNPVTPFLISVFGEPRLGADVHASFFGHWPTIGVGTALKDLLLLPWHLVEHAPLFEEFDGAIPPSTYLAPLGFVLGLVHARYRALTILCVALVIAWFYNVQAIRYLIPVLPILIFITFASIRASCARFIERVPPRWRAAGIAVACVAFAGPGLEMARAEVAVRGFPPTTADERRAYLTPRDPRFPAYDWFNRQPVSRTSLLYGYGTDAMIHYCEGRCMGDWYGPMGWLQVIDRGIGNGAALYRNLHRWSVDYFICRRSLAPQLPRDADFARHFELIYRDAEVVIFKLRP